MSSPEHNAKTVSPQSTGVFATLSSSLRATGSGASSTRPLRLTLAAFAATLAASALTAAPAAAAGPGIGPPIGVPFVRVGEVDSNTTVATAEVSAEIGSGSEVTASFQYVEAAEYDPAAANPFAAATTRTVTFTTEEVTQNFGGVHLQLEISLPAGATFYYRFLAVNEEGTSETPAATFETYPASLISLPDTRAYEQVSPVDKNHIDAKGTNQSQSMLASPSGSAFAFYSVAPFPAARGSESTSVGYLSTRLPVPAWSTEGVVPPAPTGTAQHLAGFTEDLSKSVITSEVQPPLAPGAAEGAGAINAYLLDNATGAYRLLAPNIGYGPFEFVGASADGSRVFFATEAQLLSAAPPNANLYESSEVPLDARQALAVDAEGGTFSLAFGADSTPALPYDATAAELQAALQALPSIGAGNLTVAGGPGNPGAEHPYLVAFTGALAAAPQPPLTADPTSLTGSAQTATVTTLANGRLSLVGLLPTAEGGLAPPTGSAAGPITSEFTGGEPYYLDGAVSADGSRAFFTAHPSGRIYERLTETARTIPVSSGPARWLAATPDGRFAFYAEGPGLYRFDSETEERLPLAPDTTGLLATGTGDIESGSEEVRNLLTETGSFEAGRPLSGAGIPTGTTIASVSGDGTSLFLSQPATETATGVHLTVHSEGVLGVLGASADGSYLYFVARGVLAADENANGEEALPGAANLYLWHAGTTTFIARLLRQRLALGGDSGDWAEQIQTIGAKEEHSSRLTSDGTTLLFESHARLTAYENNGQPEFYLYRPTQPFSSTNPLCLSCDPSGSPAPQFEVRFDPTSLGLGDNFQFLGGPGLNARLTRNLSTDGRRFFFQTDLGLLPQDINGFADVYEWEAPGEGTCTASAPAYRSLNGGCLYLLSTATSHSRSYFGDASADGSSVFFFTRQSLVGSDNDENVDVYDAREGGGIASQNPPAASLPCEAEACKPPVSTPPSHSTGATESFHGPEEGPNHPQKPRCRKGFVLKHGRCVKKSHHKRRGRSHRRAANTTRRAPR